MRERQPHGSQLQRPRSSGVEYPPRNIHVRYGIAVKQKIVVPQAIQESRYGDGGGDLRNQKDIVRIGWTFHSRWVNSRKTSKRASISPRVRDCRRSVPNRSTAKDPITPP